MEDILINVDSLLDGRNLDVRNSRFENEQLRVQLEDIKTGKWQKAQLELIDGHRKKRSNFDGNNSAESNRVCKRRKVTSDENNLECKGSFLVSSIHKKNGLFDNELSFEELQLNPILIRNLNSHINAIKPTNIQSHSIPVLMDSKDAFIKAQTGSGKTLAYILPILQDLITNGTSRRTNDHEYQSNEISRDMGTYAIIIAPIRELSLQIYGVLNVLLKSFCKIVPGIIIGGEKRKSEKARLRKGITVLVATPGRLLDHLKNTESFVYEFCRWLVFDEADRLLDLGFWNDLKQIIDLLNLKGKERRQNVLVSATLNKDVNKLALISLDDPMFISCDSNDIVVKPLDEVMEEELPEHERVYEIPSTLKQHVLIVDDKHKCMALIAFLRTMFKSIKAKVIIFFSNCDSVEFYYMLFSKIEIPSSLKRNSTTEPLLPCSLYKLHGKLSQLVRSDTFDSFSNCESGIMLCTDVASRGLDIPKVNWIIQYDVPSDPTSYIHRIGRTARIGDHGNALIILLESEELYLEILKKKNMKFIDLSQKEVLKNLKTNLDKEKNKNDLQECSLLHRRMEMYVENGELKELAINAYRSFIKSYATHIKATKHIFHVKNLHLGHICRNFFIKKKPSELHVGNEMGHILTKKVKKARAMPKTRSLEQNFGFEDVTYEEDVCHYWVYVNPGLGSTSEYEMLLIEILEFVNENHSNSYIWNDERFNLVFVPENDNDLGHFYGSTGFGGNIEDEWFIVHILMDLSLKYPQLVIRVDDMDGEFLLIESSNYLPKWLNPDTSQNRVWIFRNRLCIIPQSLRPENFSKCKESIVDAISCICTNTSITEASTQVQHSICKRISDSLQRAKVNEHIATFHLPVSAAFILKKSPNLVSKAINSFSKKDYLTKKTWNKIERFHSQPRVNVSIRLSRFQYSQLLSIHWTPDKSYGFYDQSSKNCPHSRSFDLGAKLTLGLEMYYRQDLNRRLESHVNQLAKTYNFESDPDWLTFLKKNPQSENFQRLIARKKMFLLDKFGLQVPEDDSVSCWVDMQLGGKEYLALDYMSEFSDADLIPESSSDWINISPEELEDIFTRFEKEQELYGRTRGENEAELKPGLFDSFAKNVDEFLELRSGYEGVDGSNSSDTDDEFYRVGYSSGEEDEVYDQLFEAMDDELEDTEMAKSFERTRDNGIDHFSNLIKSFIESHGAQNGGSGPVSLLALNQSICEEKKKK